jgi:hypothetical protein
MPAHGGMGQGPVPRLSRHVPLSDPLFSAYDDTIKSELLEEETVLKESQPG